MPKIDIATAPRKTGSVYPEPYNSWMAGRSSVRLGQAAGLTQFGVNIVHLEPGAPASLRHWHLKEDEFAMVLTGELVLIEDDAQYLPLDSEPASYCGDLVIHSFGRGKPVSLVGGGALLIRRPALSDSSAMTDSSAIVDRLPLSRCIGNVVCHPQTTRDASGPDLLV